jgi:hypothetical protein
VSHQRAVFPCSAKSLVDERPEITIRYVPVAEGKGFNTAKCPTSGLPRLYSWREIAIALKILDAGHFVDC